MSVSSPSGLGRSVAAVGETTERLAEQAREILHEVKPRFRGWLHVAIAPVTLVAGIVLIAQTPDSSIRLGLAVFIISAVMLFSVSGLYHHRTWSARTKTRLRRFDHANIFVHIAGTYTAFALLFLEPGRAAVLLTVVWLAAGAGVVFRVCWIDAPRWLHTPAYVVTASAALLFIPDLTNDAGRAAMTLMLVGAVLYLLGGFVYGVQRPNPFPKLFGFHEVFHAFTVAAFAAQFVGVSLATYSLT